MHARLARCLEEGQLEPLGKLLAFLERYLPFGLEVALVADQDSCKVLNAFESLDLFDVSRDLFE